MMGLAHSDALATVVADARQRLATVLAALDTLDPTEGPICWSPTRPRCPLSSTA